MHFLGNPELCDRHKELSYFLDLPFPEGQISVESNDEERIKIKKSPVTEVSMHVKVVLFDTRSISVYPNTIFIKIINQEWDMQHSKSAVLSDKANFWVLIFCLCLIHPLNGLSLDVITSTCFLKSLR